MKTRFFASLLFFIFLTPKGFALLNLNAFKSPFVLETKKVTIPDYPHAFNPSIVRWKDSLLMSFRVVQKNQKKEHGPDKSHGNKIGLVWLDDNFKPIGKAQIMDLPKTFPTGLTCLRVHDPRLVLMGDTLFMVYSDQYLKKVDAHILRRMFVCQVEFDKGLFSLKDFHCLRDFEDSKQSYKEKNWSPFEFEGNLLYIYKILPHRIMQLVEGTETCKTVACTKGSIDWKWGELRGGTPALAMDEEYLSFFHSCIPLNTIQSGGKEMVHYFMGAYTFSSKFPFEVTRISTNPIIGSCFYDSEKYDTQRTIRVVFPCGYFFEGPYIWLVYGRQDQEIWVAKLDKEALLKSLVPVYSN